MAKITFKDTNSEKNKQLKDFFINYENHCKNLEKRSRNLKYHRIIIVLSLLGNIITTLYILHKG